MNVSTSGEIRAQGDDANPSVLAMRQHRTVPGDDDLRTARKRAFENSIVGLIGKNRQGFGRLDEFTQLGKKDGNTRKRVAVVGKLPGENAEEFVENGSGNYERVLTLDDPAQRLVAPSAGKGKGRYQDVRVEYDPHAWRYRCKSSSVRIPCSLAFRLQ